MDTYRNGGTLGIYGMSVGGWQTNACGATVVVGGVSYQVIISISSMVDNLGAYGHCVGSDYQNSCGTWTKGTIGSNAILMINCEASTSSDFWSNF